MEQLKIVYLSPDALMPYEQNARRHAEEDLATIRASVREFGFLDPIGIWGPENIIVEGHGRQIVAKEIGMKAVPCIRLDELTEEQRRAYALAHNKTAELSEWDVDALEAELQELRESNIDMTEFGFADGLAEELAETVDAGDIEPENEEESHTGYQCPRCKMWFGGDE